jgi:hypothetical protein
LPDERKEQTPHLRNRQRQKVKRHETHIHACCFLFVRPPCRRCRWDCCACWRTTVR